MLGSDLVLEALRAEGIGTVFMVPGGLNDAFMPAMTATEGLTTVVAAHEGGAAYMADGYGRASGRFGVAFGIGGPGVLNMVTALASAKSDRTRVLAISGEVPTDLEGRGLFQDASGAGLDDIDTLRPVTGRSLAAENPATLVPDLRDVLTHLLTANEPVHLCVPTDVQHASIDDPWVPLDESFYRTRAVDHDALEHAMWPALAPADGGPDGDRHIIALAGPGVRHGTDELVAFAEKYGIGVATTLAAKGVFPEDHPLALGVFGYAGTRWAIEAICADDVDVLLVLGSDLNQRNTLYFDEAMRPTDALVHVDAIPTLIGRHWPSVPVIGDAPSVLEALTGSTSGAAERLARGADARRRRLDTIRARGPRCYAVDHEHSAAVPIHPARLVADLRAAAPRDAVMVVDSGAHRAWVGHYWDAYGPRDYLTAANFGPMGAALPMAIGSWFARPEVPHVAVIGDGCMLMHGMELHTAARHGVPLVVVVVDNGSYGNIWFRAHSMGPGPEALTDITHVDWASFATALGAHAATVTEPDQLRATFDTAFATAVASQRPYLVSVKTDKTAAKPITPWTEAMHAWEDHH